MFSGKFLFYSTGILMFVISSTIFQGCPGKFEKPYEFPYKIKKPDIKYVLEKRISEVSGLSFVSDKDIVLIDDENATLFYYNLDSRKITRQVEFARDGDYEDLSVVGDTAYILRSDGLLMQLYSLSNSGKYLRKTKIKTGLATSNDTEGICYDNINKRLLISCKGKPGLEYDRRQFKNKKAIYSYNVSNKMISVTPAFLIDENKVENMVHGTHKNLIDRLMEFYNVDVKSNFQPSGLSIHPITKELYVISSVGNLLVILNMDGVIKEVIKLPPSIFKQPEGIAFDSTGNLFITNEGKSGKGNILKFTYNPQ